MPHSVCMWFRPVACPRQAAPFLILLLWSLATVSEAVSQSTVSWLTRAEYHGELARVVFEGNLPPSDPEGGAWRMYALDSPPPSRALKVQFGSLPAGLTALDSLRQVEVQSGFDPYFDKVVTYFQGRALVWADYAIGPGFPGGEVHGSIGFMICNNLICLPPDSIDFTAAFTEAADPLGSVPIATAAPIELSNSADLPSIEDLPASDMESSDSSGLFGFLLLAIGAGFGALLMPCVYPMIPLTVSYFARHAQGTPLRMALLYGLAIVVTFTGLGVTLSILVGSAGTQIVAANPWVNLIIATAFLIFGLSLLGLFSIKLPSNLVNWFDRKGRERQDYVGVFFMGLALTLVSFTCTVPFVGLLLPSIASGGWFYGILGMGTFSITFALPFVAFACFPRALKALPGSGGWMREVAIIFGFIEIAAAIKFFSNVDLVWGLGLIDRSLAIAFWVVLAALAGLYLIGHLRLSPDSTRSRVGAGRLLFGILFLGLAVYMLPGLFGGRLGRLDAYLPPRGPDEVVMGSFDVGVRHEWITDDLPGAFSEATFRDQPLFIDFSGYTCTNCREMEVNVFERGEVSKLLASDFVLSRLYTDGPEGREFQTFQENLTGTRALPTYAIVDGRRPDQPLIQLSGVVSSERFEAFLRQGLTEYAD